ncbi:MAG: restriction endonuclease subunit S [Gaiellaceae bacterium]
MEGELNQTPLGELCDLDRGITYGIVKVGDFVVGGVPVIRGGDIRNGRIVFDHEKRVTEEVSQQFQRTILKGGEILINLIAEPGHTAIVPPELAGANVSRDVGVIPLVDTVDHRYVNYCLRSPAAVHWLTSRLQGSVTQKINLGTLRDLPIPTPDLTEQRAIAHILGTLDDKIELNRRMNETLEQVARALFKSWFVDFDPIRARSEGHDPGLPSEIADLFPDSFEDSELGEIPKGWRVVSLDQMASIQGGKQLPTGECRPNGAFPVYGANGIMGYAERTTHEGFAIAFGRVGAYCGSIHWVYRGAWVNNNASSVVPPRWPEFVLESMLGFDFDSLRTGSAQPFIPNSTLASASVLRPRDEILDTFCATVRLLRLKQDVTERQSATIASLRDALLPRLISGELRVADPTRFLERVAA